MQTKGQNWDLGSKILKKEPENVGGFKLIKMFGNH
jgi:hypothetical protein